MHPDVLRFLHLMPEAALLVTSQGEILAGNAASTQLTGLAASELFGRNLQSLVFDPVEKVQDLLRLFGRSRQLIPGALKWKAVGRPHVELRCDGAVLSLKSDQGPAVLLLRCRPKAETTEQFVILNEKITALSKEVMERRKAEAERDDLIASERAARVEAERISRVKDEFLATLSHELRTPLNAILGWSHLLLSGGDQTKSDLGEGLRTIERNARAQTRLIDDLLDMSRIISGRIRLDVQPVDLAAVIEAAVAAVRPAADARSIRLQTTLDPIAGPVRGDPGRLQQVVWNLLSNALKFTPKGGRVQILLERANSHLEIIVSDNGEGIRPEVLPHIFERFRQGDASTIRRHGGLGLGLSLVKHLVELHGGNVRAKSPGPGQGSTFIVMLPLAAVYEGESETPADRVHPAAGGLQELELAGTNLQGITVLVVDDEPDARDLVRRFLQQHQAEVITARSASEALDALAAHKPDLVVSDISMPEMDGYQLMRAIRSLPDEHLRRVPAVALTAFARTEDRTRAMLAGFNVHLSKPIEPVELNATIASLTGRTGGSAGE
jgi:signal transduction histidine kinase/CheY-like chemotaxis protein